MPSRSRRRGLSLIEVSVALAVVGALVALAAPAIVGARDASRDAVCLKQQSNLYVATAFWAHSNKLRLPGLNTTGLRYMGSLANVRKMLGDQAPDTPTSTYDWISPAIGLEAGLHPNRAKRTQQIFERLGCPAAYEINDSLYDRDLAVGGDAADFRALHEDEGFTQVSYLAPAIFHMRGPAWPRMQYVTYRWAGPVVPPRRFIPRMDTVGATSRKVFVADGTRYLTRGGVLDFDIAPNPKYFGSFTTNTPIYVGSVAYGRRVSRTSAEFAGEVRELVDEGNTRLSYRHADGINVVFFDGSGGSMTQDESYADAIAWAPGGSVFTGKRATEESKARFTEGQILP